MITPIYARRPKLPMSALDSGLLTQHHDEPKPNGTTKAATMPWFLNPQCLLWTPMSAGTMGVFILVAPLDVPLDTTTGPGRSGRSFSVNVNGPFCQTNVADIANTSRARPPPIHIACLTQLRGTYLCRLNTSTARAEQFIAE